MALLALTVYLALDIFRPEVIFPDASARIILIAGVALFLCCLLEMLVLGKRWRPCPSTPFSIGLLLAALASTVLVVVRGGGDDPWTKYLDLAKSVFLYIVAIQVVDTRGKLVYLRNVILVMIVLLAIGGILFMRGHELPGYNIDGDQRLQYTGILNDANDLGMLYVVAWAIALFGMANATGVFSRILYFFCMIPAGWAIYLTASRGAMMAGLLAVFFTFRRRFGVVIPAIGALAIVIALSKGGLARMDKLSSDEQSAEQRLVAWGQGWYMMRSNPLLGVGPRNFPEYHGKNAHSTPVQAGAEIGLIGLFCWLGLYYFPLQEFTRLSWLRDRNSSGPPVEVQQIQVALLGCMVASLFLSRLYIGTPYLLCGLVMAARSITHSDTAVEERAETRPEEAEEGSPAALPTTAAPAPTGRYTPSVSLLKLGWVQLAVLCVWRFVARDFITGI